MISENHQGSARAPRARLLATTLIDSSGCSIIFSFVQPVYSLERMAQNVGHRTYMGTLDKFFRSTLLVKLESTPISCSLH